MLIRHESARRIWTSYVHYMHTLLHDYREYHSSPIHECFCQVSIVVVMPKIYTMMKATQPALCCLVITLTDETDYQSTTLHTLHHSSRITFAQEPPPHRPHALHSIANSSPTLCATTNLFFASLWCIFRERSEDGE